VIGVDGAKEEALLGEDGALETGKAQFSIEPFLFIGGKLVTWHDATITQSLDQGYLPIPSVQWTNGSLELAITAFASGRPDGSYVIARYRVTKSREGSPAIDAVSRAAPVPGESRNAISEHGGRDRADSIAVARWRACSV
jgi:hypothetical protein